MLRPFYFASALYLVLLSACSNNSSTNEEPVGLHYELQIIDSVMVDHIGLMTFSDISPDESKLIGYDKNTLDFIITDSNGNIINQFNKTGDRPDGVGPSLASRPKFINDHHFAVSSLKGLYIYDLKGNLVKLITPDYKVQSNIRIAGADHLHQVDDSQVIIRLEGRAREDGSLIEDGAGPRLELVNLENDSFEGIIKMPVKSRLSSGEVFPIVNTVPFFSTASEKLFLFFTNDDQFYVYDLNELEKEEETYRFPQGNFQLVKGKDPKKDGVDVNSLNFDWRDFFYGSIENVLALEDKLLVVYKTGLSDQEYKSVAENVDNPSETYQAADKVNARKVILIGHDGKPYNLDCPENIASFQFQNKNGDIYLALTSDEEKDYEVIYKARLVVK